MIKTLTLHNFVKHKNLTLDFQPGVSVICGRNGAGKSLILEAIAFALFGTSALRGKKDEYDKDLSVELEVEIKSKPHKIVRTLTNCKVDDVSVGTTASSNLIRSLFGYGEDVFYFSNLCKQNELTRLTDVAPAERKRTIDEIVDVSKIDEAIKKAKDELSTEKAVRSAIVVGDEPLAPEVPQIESEDEIKKKMDENSTFMIESHVLKVMKENLGELPEEPKCGKVSAEEVNSLEHKMAELKQEELELHYFFKMFDGTSEPKSEEYLAEQERLIRDYVELPKVPKPTLDKETVEQELEIWRKHDEWEKSKSVVCPHCGKEFKLIGEEPENPQMDYDDLISELKSIEAWRGFDLHAVQLPKPEMNQMEIGSEREYAKWFGERKENEKRLKKVEEQMAICGDTFKTFKSCRDAWLDYESKLASYNSMSKSIAEQTKKVAGLPKHDDESLVEKKQVWERYRSSVQVYEALKKIFDEKKSKADELDAKIEQREHIIEAFKTLKLRLKSFVIPSLERVSSELLRVMSANELNFVEISEDFDISVDGRRVALLSGSEKALVNIAIRIALGRVLTKGVFNVFLADEIDAAMSEERANEVQTALYRIKDKVKQIVLVSHKPNLEPVDERIEV